MPKVLHSGRFELIESIGSGGAAEVWRARDRQAGRDVAIKVLDPTQGRAEEYASRFVAEAKVMHELRHPRIVRVHAIGRDNGWYWFAMDLLPGGSMKDLLEKGEPVPPERALRLTFDVLAALAAVHEHGIVHRDVKPHNVLIDADDHGVLTDFGLARHKVGAVKHETQTGEFFGSFGYIAPEQRKDPRQAEARSDLFSVGATLYHLASARKPSDLALMDVQPEAVAKLPAPLFDVVKRACAYKPADRFPDARAMASAVAAAHDALSGKAPEATRWMSEFDATFLPPATRKGCLGWFA